MYFKDIVQSHENTRLLVFVFFYFEPYHTPLNYRYMIKENDHVNPHTLSKSFLAYEHKGEKELHCYVQLHRLCE